ncbi:MAG TPA: caspase family protein [Flammeovirgaceae bacterium]|nr:caspase family protein [Flammeovirgaceae bacterium]
MFVKMPRTNYLFSILLFGYLLLSASVYAQQLNGTWTGTGNWGVQNFDMRLELEEHGQNVTAVFTLETPNKKKWATYEMTGRNHNGVITLLGTRYIEKKGLWCLAGLEFDTNKSPAGTLTGKWKGNAGNKGGCLMAGIGKIELHLTNAPAVATTPPPAITPETRGTATIATDDRLGNAMLSELQKRKYYALFIAVQDYRDDQIVDLNQPIADARALRDELVAEYNFDPQDIIFLQNPDRTQIIETFDHLTNQVQPTDNLLIFYAGHGIWDDKIDQGYWLPADAKKSSKAAWLSNGTIRDYIRAIDSRHTLLITDACFGGGILKTRQAFTASRAMLEMYKLPSRKAMTSGALKTVPDKSVFVEYLIKALQHNNQPLLSADQLFNSFKYNVINNSPNGQVPQYGVIYQAHDEGGEFIFLKKQD